MKRIRETLDINNQIVSSDSLSVIYMRIQPITTEIKSKLGTDNASSLLYTGQKIFFTPYVDILPTDKILLDSKLYEIKSFYKARTLRDTVNHIEVII